MNEEPFGLRVKAYRNKMGWDQQTCTERVAAKSGRAFGRSGWAKLENSPFRNVRMDRIQSAAWGLDISLEEARAMAGYDVDRPEDSVETHIGNAIASCRIIAGLSVEYSSAALGVTPPLFRRIEKGLDVLSAVQMYQLATLFGCSMNEIYGAANPPASTGDDDLAELKDELDNIRQMLVETKG